MRGLSLESRDKFDVVAHRLIDRRYAVQFVTAVDQRTGSRQMLQDCTTPLPPFPFACASVRTAPCAGIADEDTHRRLELHVQ